MTSRKPGRIGGLLDELFGGIQLPPVVVGLGSVPALVIDVSADTAAECRPAAPEAVEAWRRSTLRLDRR